MKNKLYSGYKLKYHKMSHKSVKVQRIMENKEEQSKIAKENKKKLQETKQMYKPKADQIITQTTKKHIDVKPHVDKYDKKISSDMYDAYTIKEPESSEKYVVDKEESFM